VAERANFDPRSLRYTTGLVVFGCCVAYDGKDNLHHAALLCFVGRLEVLVLGVCFVLALSADAPRRGDDRQLSLLYMRYLSSVAGVVIRLK